MKKQLQNNCFKKLAVFTAILIFIPKLVFADVWAALSEETIPMIHFIIILEAIIFWFLANIVLKNQFKLLTSLLVVFTANIVTSIVGIAIPIYGIVTVGIAFVLSAVIEWFIYIMFIKKVEFSKFDLFKMSFVANVASYIMLAVIYNFQWKGF